jgi:uncharacterized protein YigA (DUF484 family)
LQECTEQKSLVKRAKKGQRQAEEVLEQRTQDLRNAQSRQLPLENKIASLQAQLTDAERHARSAECALESLQTELAEEKAKYDILIQQVCFIILIISSTVTGGMKLERKAKLEIWKSK